MRITVLTYVEREGDKEYDAVIPQVVKALRANGHEVSVLGVHGDVRRVIRGLARRKPDLVFNLLETFGEDCFGDVAGVAMLDLLGQKYTGGGPGEFYLSGDKVLAKKVLAFEGILYPKFAVFTNDAGLETGGNLRMPLFVKPLRTDASIGIDSAALVHDSKSLMKRVAHVHEEFHDAALAEEYIDGREFYVGVLGNLSPIALPPIEMDFSKLPEGLPKILDSKAKWEEGSPEFDGTQPIIPDLPDALRAKLQEISIAAYRALRVRDYGRVDLRMSESGEIYVLEVNASCYLERTSEFASAAEAAGIGYEQLIQRIVDAALERYPKLREERPRARRKAERRRSASAPVEAKRPAVGTVA